MKKVLIGGPVRQKPNVLKCFLDGLKDLDIEGIQVGYYFVDDNTDKKSIDLLQDFSKDQKNVLIKYAKDFQIQSDGVYNCDNITHNWKRELIEKITMFKNDIIDYSIKQSYDYLFFVDSDIVLCKNTLKHLLSRNVEIVSNVFWSQWVVGGPLEPQVWIQDTGSMYINNWDKPISKAEERQKRKNFFAMLKIPGLYEVGGLGACTLIKVDVLREGVNFSLVKNISFWGEDRHFCVRAAARDIKLYVDTVYPVYHIYRESYVDRVDEFKKDGFKFDMCQTYQGIPLRQKIKLKTERLKRGINKIKAIIKDKVKVSRTNKFLSKRNKYMNGTENDKIVLSLVVHNEENRYLEKMLSHAIKYVNSVVIIDDASTDNTVNICEQILKDFPHKIIKNKKSLFATEYKLRELQWKETMKENPGWVLSLDADEIFEDTIIDQIKYMIKDNSVDAYRFRLYDMWNEDCYRSDKLWCAHENYGTFLIRVLPKFHYKFKHTNQHCGRLPKNLQKMPYVESLIRLKHFGWAKEEDRENKYKRYKKLDPDGRCGNLEQYESILDKNPHLVKF
ncbi:MAG: glycosyltransferase [Christensenellales bacterium]